MIKQPKFKIGDTVNHRPDLYGQTVSVVREIDRTFHRKSGGLAYLESMLPSLREEIKWEIKDIDGVPTLILHPWMSTAWCTKAGKEVPTMTEKEIVPFSRYSYVTMNSEMSTIWPEKSLKN